MILPPENFVTGLGGWVVVNAGGVAYPVAEWEMESIATLVDTTTSSSAGRRRNTVITDGTWTINVPWNSVGTPEQNGFVPGANLSSLELRIGGSAGSYIFAAIVEKVRIVCNNTNEVVRVVISGFAQNGVGVPQPATP